MRRREWRKKKNLKESGLINWIGIWGKLRTRTPRRRPGRYAKKLLVLLRLEEKRNLRRGRNGRRLRRTLDEKRSPYWDFRTKCTRICFFQRGAKTKKGPASSHQKKDQEG